MEKFTSQKERIETLEKFVSELKSQIDTERNVALLKTIVGDYVVYYLCKIRFLYEDNEAKTQDDMWDNFTLSLEFEVLSLKRSKSIKRDDSLDASVLSELYSQPFHAKLKTYIEQVGFTIEEYDNLVRIRTDRSHDSHSNFDYLSSKKQQEQIKSCLKVFQEDDVFPFVGLQVYKELLKKVVMKLIEEFSN